MSMGGQPKHGKMNFKELGYDPLIDGRSLSPMVVDDLTKSSLYNNLIIHLKY